MSVWEEILIPILIGPVCLFGKYLWDIWYDREQDILRRKHEKQMETWEENIRNFYWPLYLGLIENQQLWKHAILHRMVEGNATSLCNEEESSEDEDEAEDHTFSNRPESKCAFLYNNGQGPQCGVYISKHQRRLFGNYCMAHFLQNYRNHKTTMSWKSSDASNMIVTQEQQVQPSVQNVNEIRELIMENQNKMVNIIHLNLPRIHTKTRLGKYIIQFQQYVTQFNAVNKGCKQDVIQNARIHGASYPKKLMQYLEETLIQTQQSLIERTENFYAELESSRQWCYRFWNTCGHRVSASKPP